MPATLNTFGQVGTRKNLGMAVNSILDLIAGCVLLEEDKDMPERRGI